MNRPFVTEYTTTSTRETIYKLARKYSDGDYQIYFESDDIQAVTENMAKLLAARPWATMRDDLVVIKTTVTTTTTQEIG